jgi:hypothetical protein
MNDMQSVDRDGDTIRGDSLTYPDCCQPRVWTDRCENIVIYVSWGTWNGPRDISLLHQTNPSAIPAKGDMLTWATRLLRYLMVSGARHHELLV